MRRKLTCDDLPDIIENIDEITCCYAVLQDYEWIGGVTEDEVAKILKDLDPETRITFVDCHM